MSSYTNEDRNKMEAAGQRTIFDQINETKEKIDFEHTKFSLDEFSGQEEPYSDMLVGFDLTKTPNDPDFVVVGIKEDFSKIDDFKKLFNCELAFAQKEGTDCSRIVALFEKRSEALKLMKIDKNPATIRGEIESIVTSQENNLTEDEDTSISPSKPVSKATSKSNKI